MGFEIKNIGVAGAGTMGTGIASVCALKGFKTFVYDVNEQALSRSHAVIFRSYDNLTEKNKISAEEKSKAEKAADAALEWQKEKEAQEKVGEEAGGGEEKKEEKKNEKTT